MALKSLRILAIDMVLISLALVAALVLRENLEFSIDRLTALLPYWIFTLLVTAFALPLFGVTTIAWRYSSMRAYLDIAAASVAIVAGALLMTFIANRLDGISRALPVLQWLLTISFLVGARVSSRLWHSRRSRREWAPDVIASTAESVLVVGFSKLAELYLHCISDCAPQRVRVVGLLDQYAELGLVLSSQRVLGTPEQVANVLRTLEVHGVVVTRIVLAIPLDHLSIEARAALFEVEATRSIPLEFLDEKITLRRSAQPATKLAANSAELEVDGLNARVGETLTSSRYRTVKRANDVALSLLLLIVTAPIMCLVALVVALDVGLPLLFWQERPGLGGQPFKVFKFRTMGAAHDAHGRRKLDSERISGIGNFLRRTRLDELPQLISILTGHMSFVGPRPLLPIDQPTEYSARLLVRPGLTGWAQIKGGRAISPTDKSALDVWYVKNMSFMLDVRIVLGTIPMIIFGERVEAAAIERAWQELEEWQLYPTPISSAADG